MSTGLPSTRPTYTKKTIRKSTTSKSPVIAKRDPPSLPPIGGGGGPLFDHFDGSNENHIKELKLFLRKLPKSLKKELSDFLLWETASASSKNVDRELNLWVDSILFYLRTILPSTSDKIMPKNPIYKSFVESHREVSAFCAGSDVPVMTIYQRALLYNILAELLVKYSAALARKHKFPLSLKYVLQSSSRIPGLFDSAYPGYLRSGLLLMVLKSRQVSERPEDSKLSAYK